MLSEKLDDFCNFGAKSRVRRQLFHAQCTCQEADAHVWLLSRSSPHNKEPKSCNLHKHGGVNAEQEA